MTELNSHPGYGRRRSQAPTINERSTSDPETIETVLDAVTDSAARELLQASLGGPSSARQLAEECDLPQSTTYRKLEILTEVGFLEERVEVQQNGNHVSKYLLRVDSLSLSIAEDECLLDVSVSE